MEEAVEGWGWERRMEGVGEVLAPALVVVASHQSSDLTK